MKTIAVNFFIIISLVSTAAFGASVVDIGNENNHMKLVQHQSSTLMEFCIDNQCQTYPDSNAYLYGFKGTDNQWQDFFEHCSQFNHLNNLILTTDILVVLTGVNILGSANLLIRSSKFLTSLALGSASVVNDSSYPDVESAHVYRSQDYYQSLKHSEDAYYEEKPVIEFLNQIFKDCSTDFSDYFIRREHIKSQRLYEKNNRYKWNSATNIHPSIFTNIRK